MNPQTIIFIGRSGCGKGTQAKLVEKYIKENDTMGRALDYVEIGAGLREFLKGESYTSKLTKEIYLRSDRQSDYIAIWMWSHQLIEKMTGEEHIIIDGTPRLLTQALVLSDAFNFYERPLNVIYVNISREVAVARLMHRGRSDDSLIQINKRLDWFDTDVVPAIEYFQKRALENPAICNFIEVSGEQEIEKVHADILAQLKVF